MSVGTEGYHWFAQASPVEEGSLRMAPILGVPRLLTRLGVDPDSVIAESGLDPGSFDDPENRISFVDLGQFLSLCVERTGCGHFGLLMGQDAGLGALGLVGHLAQHSPDVGSAIRDAISYLHLHDRGALPVLWMSGNSAVLSYTVYQPDVPGIKQIYDVALAITFNVLQSLVGPGWKASEVRLSHQPPEDIQPYRRYFRTRVCFSAEHSAIVFPASLLDRPLDSANALVHQQIMAQLQILETQGTGDLSSQIRRVLLRLLVGGARQDETSLGRIADLFAIHRRTLNRRLSVEGTSFRELIEESRYDIARQLLRDTGLSALDIASTLDYADAAAFSRAFRRWSGTTPAAWRTANQTLG